MGFNSGVKGLNTVILVLSRPLENINVDWSRLGYDPVRSGKHFIRTRPLPLS